MLKRAKRSGDTIIEVLFAVTVFSAIAIGSITIMNQGISVAQNSLEINLVRNSIDSQAELLRYLQNAKLTTIGRGDAGTEHSTDVSRLASEWDKIIRESIVENAADYSALRTYDQCDFNAINDDAVLVNNGPDRDKVFFLNTRKGTVHRYGEDPLRFQRPGTFAQIRQPLDSFDAGPPTSEMVWIQAVKSSSDSSTLENTVAYDFHIRACWQGSGPSVDLLKIGTIVRLYMPREDL